MTGSTHTDAEIDKAESTELIGFCTRPRASVSVVIPCYNCAQYIVGALQSVVQQSYEDYEIIVVDDNSTDDTRATVLNSGVPCKYVMNVRSKGPAGARNHGILLSQAEYIAFLDADDAWLPNKLDMQIAAMQADLSLIALGGVMIPWNGSVTERDSTRAVCTYGFEEMILRNRLATPTVVCRRESLAAVGMFDESMNISEDYDLWLRLSRVGSVGRIGMPMARFRQRPDGLSAGNRDRTFKLDEQFMRSLSSRYRDVPEISRLVRRGLSSRSLERAIELCDEEKRYGAAMLATIDSIWNWPWAHSCKSRDRFTRLRRIRRILLDAISSRRRSPRDHVGLERQENVDCRVTQEKILGVPRR